MTALTPNILTTESYMAQQRNAVYNNGEDDLDRDAFLQLFTAQLKSQNPLDPMKNEAFVAQLAQFSSVEGIKGMQASLETLVSNLRTDSLLTGSSLVGKKVAIDGGVGSGGGGGVTETMVSLPNDADSLILSVYSGSDGSLVYREEIGALDAGEHRFGWPGLDANGNQMPKGEYRFTASAIIDGKLVATPTSVLNEVASVTWNPSNQQLDLQLRDGSSVSLDGIRTISN
ncbi:Flagellar basal-body rod modification protein FlgD [Aequoribacter fuscus]|jgi:flagellar basal-body rod modification protein FlgD|uniref:Basal-body rod modification protein FlgD n=1 Tax=Aequoribacter fuscus TaxID=2518989 RepID=F3L5U3_9GAMM|nr:flagellar hook capping FlgD N-terminal domain-containing protein [Aequoribacter fuscus]EGG28298.1 Flagellar basal-body rod modification protein FlgD [Aequoribacter fuscus]QHJ89085.1 hypothetical protein EYZ66_12615 [Aequoribacter fuscus]